MIPAALTRQETIVLQHIWDGYRTREIAEKLFIEIRSVEFHRYNLMRKWRARNMMQVIRIGVKEGMLLP